MTREEALELLKDAPNSINHPSRVNPNLTQDQVATIVRNAVEEMSEGKKLDDLTVKRVYQVVQNKRRPKY